VSETPTIRPPRAYRLIDRAILAGVAAGLGAHSRFQVWAIRLGFVVASVWKFSGAIAYAVLWLVLPSQDKTVPIGLVAAERQGLRASTARSRWPRVIGWVVVLPVGWGISRLIYLYDTSWLGHYSTGIYLIGWGIGLVWITHDTAWPRWGKALMMAGGILVAWSISIILEWDILYKQTGWSREVATLAAVVSVATVTTVACLVVALPWLVHPPRSVEDKQAELIAETRADMAAHLHDSVLQTLAVIQKQSDDAKTVAQLARRQERELRQWLYGEHIDDESAKAALQDIVAEVEAGYQVAVELVTVGDHEMVVQVDALVRAAREAVLNAAKHSGADKIDVYAEISPSLAEVFVRDRGRGFEMGDIGEDRMGIRRSIIGRMDRYGGKVDIRSTVGEGTEIHLSMPLDEKGTGHD